MIYINRIKKLYNYEEKRNRVNVTRKRSRTKEYYGHDDRNGEKTGTKRIKTRHSY